jgi:hypothetical protein
MRLADGLSPPRLGTSTTSHGSPASCRERRGTWGDRAEGARPPPTPWRACGAGDDRAGGARAGGARDRRRRLGAGRRCRHRACGGCRGGAGAAPGRRCRDRPGGGDGHRRARHPGSCHLRAGAGAGRRCRDRPSGDRSVRAGDPWPRSLAVPRGARARSDRRPRCAHRGAGGGYSARHHRAASGAAREGLGESGHAREALAAPASRTAIARRRVDRERGVRRAPAHLTGDRGRRELAFPSSATRRPRPARSGATPSRRTLGAARSPGPAVLLPPGRGLGRGGGGGAAAAYRNVHRHDRVGTTLPAAARRDAHAGVGGTVRSVSARTPRLALPRENRRRRAANRPRANHSNSTGEAT